MLTRLLIAAALTATPSLLADNWYASFYITASVTYNPELKTQSTTCLGGPCSASVTSSDGSSISEYIQAYGTRDDMSMGRLHFTSDTLINPAQPNDYGYGVFSRYYNLQASGVLAGALTPPPGAVYAQILFEDDLGACENPAHDTVSFNFGGQALPLTLDGTGTHGVGPPCISHSSLFLTPLLDLTGGNRSYYVSANVTASNSANEPPFNEGIGYALYDEGVTYYDAQGNPLGAVPEPSAILLLLTAMLFTVKRLGRSRQRV